MSDEDQKADESQAADLEESSTLETDLQAKMDALQDESGDDDPVLDDEGNEVTPDPTDTEIDDPDKKDDDPDKKDDESLLLPSGHRRAALAGGFTGEEIDHYLETKPEEAKAKFEEIYNKWQERSSLWSERGRQLIAAGKTVSEEGEDKDKETSEVLPHYDTEALIEKHGNEDLIHALVDPLNAMVDRLNTTAEKLSNSENFLRETEETALITVTQDFFKSKDMEAYKDEYGIGVQELTESQVDKRMKLFEQADIIVAGAKAHGVNITVPDALERAHVIISQGTRDEAIRRGIRDSMKKRTKTTKSSHIKTSTVDEDQPISDEELVKRTEARLQTLRDKK